MEFERVNKIEFAGRERLVGWKKRRPWCNFCLGSGAVVAARKVGEIEHFHWANCPKCNEGNKE